MKNPGRFRPGLQTSLLAEGSEVHPAHAAVAARKSRRLLLRRVDDRGFRRDDETGDRGRVLQRGADDLRRVDDADLGRIAKLGLVAR